ncbi:MAG: response regulator [Candidatus Omnitrophica bacterium]|nr:response regulator [Candidatus Omnitrophota bacterium]
MQGANSNSAYTLASTLSTAVKKVFYEKSGTKFSSVPKLRKKLIVQYDDKMRIDAMEKFNAPTVFSVLEFAANEEALNRQEYVLTLIVYLDREYLAELLRLLQYPYIDSDDEKELKDGCGTLVNLIGGQYKREMAAVGHEDLAMSHFRSYINSAGEGLEFPSGSTDKYEISFDIEDVKRIVVEVIAPAWLQKQHARRKRMPKRVLVIDDDRILIKTVEPLLRSQGFEVLAARDGKEGMSKLKEKPHLIILDLQMPNMNGYEFILEMQKRAGSSRVPIVILTAKEGMEDTVMVEGVKEYLTKPFVPATFLNSILRHI